MKVKYTAETSPNGLVILECENCKHEMTGTRIPPDHMIKNIACSNCLKDSTGTKHKPVRYNP